MTFFLGQCTDGRVEGQPATFLGTGAGITSHGSATAEQCGCRRERARQPSSEGVLALAVPHPPFSAPTPAVWRVPPHEMCIPQGDPRWLEQCPRGTSMHGHDTADVFPLQTLSSAQPPPFAESRNFTPGQLQHMPAISLAQIFPNYRNLITLSILRSVLLESNSGAIFITRFGAGFEDIQRLWGRLLNVQAQWFRADAAYL